jgi:predicted metalloendopeptidase
MKRTRVATLVLGSGILLGLTLAAPEKPERDKRTEPAIDAAELDANVRPQDDFWRYVNGKWHARTAIPADEARWGSFSTLRDKSREDVRAIIDDTSKRTDLAAGSPGQKVRDLYNSFMDNERIERAGVEPLRAELAAIAALPDRTAVATYFATALRAGIPGPLGLRINQDQAEPDRYIVYLSQGGLGLPDRDYYFDTGEKADGIRAGYVALGERLFGLAGLDRTHERVAAAFALETALAKHHWTRVDNRDRIKTYNKKTADEVRALAPDFPWAAWLGTAGIAGEKDLVVRQPSYFEALSAVLAAQDLATWKDYLTLRLLVRAAPFLSEPFFQAHFAFYGKALEGREVPEQRWERGVDLVNRTLGELVGQEYVSRHFPPEAKVRMEQLVANLKLAMAESLDRVPWMTEATKREAQAKLAKFGTKIGYPERWRDYGALEIAPDDLVGNLRRAAEFEHRRDLARLGQPIDRAEWFMSPQTVNAYYTPSLNEIVFPAAILQPPFFHLEADDAVNYGAIGAVIGHEIGHGFDDQGRKSDGAGVLREWWTPKDAEEYNRRADQLVRQYERFSPVEGLTINGRLTLGENIGDLGGLALAWRAYQKSLEGKQPPAPIDGLTAEQRFFVSFAQIWRSKEREDYLRQQIKTDSHSPSRYRLMGTLPNFDPFVAAFGIREGDGMWIPPAERVSIW